MAKPRVPQFGKWESEGNQPYTHYFNVARKEKIEGKIIMNPNDPEQNPAPFQQEKYPKQKNVNISAQSSYPPMSNPRRKASRDSLSSESSSPYRDFDQAKQHGKSRGSLRSVPNTPDRSGAPGQKGAAVPRFGEWENNPGAEEGYTHIFQNVRDDRKVGAPPKNDSHKNTPKLVTSYEDKGCGCFSFFRN